MAYGPVRSVPGRPQRPPARELGWITNSREGGRDPEERDRPEIPPPPVVSPTPGEGEVPPETTPPEPGPGGPEAPRPSNPRTPTPLPPTMAPGDAAALAPYRTPAFFTNRFVGGAQLPQTRFGAGAPLAGTPPPTEDEQRRPAQLDPEMLRALVAKFGGGGGIQ